MQNASKIPVNVRHAVIDECTRTLPLLPRALSPITQMPYIFRVYSLRVKLKNHKNASAEERRFRTGHETKLYAQPKNVVVNAHIIIEVYLITIFHLEISQFSTHSSTDESVLSQN